MRRLILGLILIGGCDCGGGVDDGASDAAVDGAVDGAVLDAGEDSGASDMGPPPLALRVEPVVGVSGDGSSGIDYLELPVVVEIVAGSANEMVVPGEPRDTGLLRDFFGRRDAGGEFRWLRMTLPSVNADWFEDSTWFGVTSSSPSAEYTVEEDPIEEPTLIRWGSDESVSRFPIPEDVSLWALPGAGSNLIHSDRFLDYVQEWEPLGTARMVTGDAPSGTTLGGTLLEGPDDRIPFVGFLSDEGLSGVRALGSRIRVGTNGGEPNDVGLIAVMPGGDLVLTVSETADGEGEVFGEPVGASQGLFRIDPVAGTVVRQWAWDTSARTIVLARFDEPHLSVTTHLSEGDTLTAGGQTYLSNGATDSVTYRWDGVGPLPEPERRPSDGLPGDGLWVAGDDFDPSVLLRRYDESHALALTVRTTGVGAFLTPWEGRLWAAVVSASEALEVRLVAEGAATFDVPLEPVTDGNRTLWVVELDPETGEILRRRAVDLGPLAAGEDEPPMLVRPLTADHFIVGRGSVEEPRATLTAHSIDGGEPTVIEARLEGRALSEETCETLQFDPFSVFRPLRIPLEFDPWTVSLRGYCVGGENELIFGDATFSFSDGRSQAVFRLVPE